MNKREAELQRMWNRNIKMSLRIKRQPLIDIRDELRKNKDGKP